MLSLLIFIGLMASCGYYYHRDTIHQAVQGYRYLCDVHHGSHWKTLLHLVASTGHLAKAYATQHFLHNSFLVKKGVYDIEYTIHLKTFRFRTTYQRGPCRYRTFTSSITSTTSTEPDDVDVSLHLLPYVGPNHDFHRIAYTPKDFGYSNLSIHYHDGTVRTFGPDEVLV